MLHFLKGFLPLKKWDALPVYTQETIYHVHTEMRQTLATLFHEEIMSKFGVARLCYARGFQVYTGTKLVHHVPRGFLAVECSLSVHFFTTTHLAEKVTKWAAAWQNQQNYLCAQRRLRSAWASPSVWSESSLCALLVAKDPMLLHADSEDSDQIGRMPSPILSAQADLSLRWAHRLFCWFCHAHAQMLAQTSTDKKKYSKKTSLMRWPN